MAKQHCFDDSFCTWTFVSFFLMHSWPVASFSSLGAQSTIGNKGRRHKEAGKMERLHPSGHGTKTGDEMTFFFSKSLMNQTKTKRDWQRETDVRDLASLDTSYTHDIDFIFITATLFLSC